MIVETFEVRDVVALLPQVFEDDRGHFFEAWNQQVFEEATGYSGPFVQDNQSRSLRGVLRGLHFQTEPHVQGKLVRVVRGAVWDVAVDIRRSSVTFGRWVGAELNADNRRQFWVPPGFAHGFCVLSDFADVLYKTTDFYAPDCDRAIRWNDPVLGIEWPLEGEPRVSPKDEDAPLLADADVFD
jgi:dTDP-4-dehydrorhamnose 3,5-epimerase